ncbi:MAG TPA: NAD-dependent epimerase/dehydratase family protein [Thermomicrobiaceae bacterium]|nr:NAD-dependent epimerase/dehydratase family protein [Thermomicrobiaceae bacterium]
MRALVTGCAGFVGSHLSERLLQDGYEVVGIDCFTDYYDREIKEANLARLRDQRAFALHEVDLACADLEPLVDGVDVIFHQAGQPGVRASWGAYFDSYTRHNIQATQRLLEAVKDRPLTNFVYASSSSVYGDAESFPTSEEMLPRPVSPYGVTKLAGEQLVYLYWRNYGVPTVALRYFTVYGPRQRPDMAFNRFIHWAMTGQPIQIYGDGEQTRDFTFISDIVAANLAAAASGLGGKVFNIGGGSRVSVNQVLAIVRELLDCPLDVRYVANQRGDVRHTSANTSRARAALNYAPKVDLRAGLEMEVAWLLDASSRAAHDIRLVNSSHQGVDLVSTMAGELDSAVPYGSAGEPEGV